MSRRAISLSNELHLLMDSIHGVRSLTKQWIDSFGLDHDLPRSIFSLLVVLTERLRLVDRAVQGYVDPRLAWCPQNDAISAERDILLRSWSDKVLAEHHENERQRAVSRLAPRKPKAKKRRTR